MNELQIPRDHIHKLLCSKNPDAALLYLYIAGDGDLAKAEASLQIPATRYACAAALLRQLGLWPEEKAVVELSGERPQYTERDVLNAMDADRDFQSLYGELQRVLGRSLNTEELKIILGFTRYLGLPADVISVLVCYCKERARQKGNLRAPSLRAIEKEAYRWAELGIDSMDEAVAYIQNETLRRGRLAGLLKILQIRGRALTPGEERYAQSWLDMGFEDKALALAYERTCLNTGGLSWAYMNKILVSWHNAGLHTLAQVNAGDKKKTPNGATGQPGQAELDAIAKLLKEG